MKANLFLIIAACLWGLNFHLGKIILNEVGFIEAGLWRYFFGITMLLLLSIKEISSLKITTQNIKGLSLVGIVGLFGFNVFFFLGLQHSSAINAALIISLNPAITVLLSNRILKTSISKIDVFGMVLSLIGTTYLITSGSLVNLLAAHFNYGDILIFIANIFFAFHHVWVKKYNYTMSNAHFTVLTSLLCMVCFLFLIPFADTESIVEHTSSFWLSVIGIGCFGTSLAYTFWNKGVTLTTAHTAGAFMNLVPLSTTLLSFLFHETLYQYHFIGGGIIIIGIIILNAKR
ncbi:DMT family transporter [Mariniflexile sp. HMF6888]|uniref:DMT family transporter n=1 Tax=Mariniflexile sp. HMF6888 TaxID=3373086 RepID=UPI0037A059BA